MKMPFDVWVTVVTLLQTSTSLVSVLSSMVAETEREMLTADVQRREAMGPLSAPGMISTPINAMKAARLSISVHHVLRSHS